MDIYLDYAATAPIRAQVLAAMMPALKEIFGNPDSSHGFGRKAAALVTDARDRIADLLGVKPSEVYFTAGGTEADNWAVRGLGRGNAVVSATEHAAVLSALPFRGGKTCAVDEDGIIDLTNLQGTMSEDVGLLAVMSVNNEVGTIQPVAALAALAHAHEACFFSDCVQAACSQDLKKLAAACDALSLSSHKVGGPKGAGALIVKKGVKLAPLLVGGEQERRLRGGTLNVAAIAGFAKALELTAARREQFCAHTGRLRAIFEEILFSALKERVRQDGEMRAPNISHLTFEDGGEALLALLDLHGVAASGGAACSAHAALPSHVMIAMGRTEEEARRGVRFSFGLSTTEEEAVYAAKTVVSCLQ